VSALPQALDPRSFDALHNAPEQWQPAMEALVRELGWQGEWRAAGEGTVLVALLDSERPQAWAAPSPPPEGVKKPWGGPAVSCGQVLKLYPPFLRDHWAFERGMLGKLHGQLGVPTPELLGSGEREGWTWTLMGQLPGTALTQRWPQMREPARLALLRSLGHLAAQVQALPVGTQAEIAPPWTAFITRQRGQCQARQERTGLPAHLLAQLPAFLDGPVPEGSDVLLTGEYTPMNLLVDADDALCGLFDFGDGMVGPAAYDWLGPLCFLCGGDAARVQAWFGGLGVPVPADPEPLLRLMLLHRYSHLPIQLASLERWQTAADFPSLARRLLGLGD
jgi:hygromycin-B 7''-O-kinase